MEITSTGLEALSLRPLLSSPEWLVEETGFDPHQINVFETKFTIGNGYLGTRGSLEEGHMAGLPGTYINGVFDHFDSFIVELVNAPDWSEIALWVEGGKLGLHTCKVLEHYRALDMKQGVLYRFTRFEDKDGRITRYESIRYASFAQQHLCEVKVAFTPENYTGKVQVAAPIDGEVFNLDLEPAYKEKPQFAPEVKWDKWTKSKHLGQVDSGVASNNGVYLEMKTLERPYHIFYACRLNMIGHETTITNRFDYEKVSQTAEVFVEQGTTYHVEKLVSIYTSRDVDKPGLRKAGEKMLNDGLKQSFEQRFAAHVKSWEQKWEDCDVVIEGDERANHAVRFNIYHLLITANEKDEKANIGAKSMSGEGYKGHVFWDTEIFLLPFYIYTQPRTAKALLMYRYHTMQGAREYAREGGYSGIRYPWESADTGHETTPPWTADGKERIWTGEREIHITSAVAYGIITYFTATQDEQFMAEYGVEILLETARFWESRLEYNRQHDRYELNGVEGPDEFHELVNNSVYTNWLAKWNLQKSADYFYWLKESYPDACTRLSDSMRLKEEEIKAWNDVAKKIYIPFDPDKKLVEEFEGYFKLKEVPITEWDANNMPVYPEGYDHFNCGGTTLVKQPDVLMLMYILPDEFTSAIKKVNYGFYEARTMHKSSLSPAIHTIMGIETGNYEKASQYFERAAFVDLVDNQGNTEWGIHIASAGGTWQAIVNGFGGMRVINKRLSFKPWLPASWKGLSFKVKWQGDHIQVYITKGKVRFIRSSDKSLDLQIEISGRQVSLPREKEIVVEWD